MWVRSDEDVFSLSHCQVGFEKLTVADKNSWNNSTVAHIILKFHKLTDLIIILCMNVVQLLKH